MGHAGVTEDLRPYAFAVAYRMLGEIGDSEDLAQEALLRLYGAREAGERIESPRAYLATVTTRLAIDHLRSARVRRERYVGSWLPEPLVAGAGPDVAARAELDDTLSMAFLVVLDTLGPVERAVFLLHEVFDFGYAEIAEVVGRGEAACRQIALRARRRVDERRRRARPAPERRDELSESFFAALHDGDVDGLVRVLADDVELHGDGGGKVPALARSLHGADRVARTLVNWSRVAARAGVTTVRARVNGQPGARFVDEEGRTLSVMAVDLGPEGVRAVHSVINPDKLGHVGPLADPEELGRRLRTR